MGNSGVKYDKAPVEKTCYLRPEGTYTGYFHPDKLTGHGEIKLSGGESYQGDIVDGLPHGYGKMLGSSGLSYEGGFERGCFHGQGVVVDGHNHQLTGHWQMGRRHGQFMYQPTLGDHKELIYNHGQVIWSRDVPTDEVLPSVAQVELSQRISQDPKFVIKI